ncbi:ATP-binding protein [Streptococcus pluranimalium]|uniref:ATP-binding protein n=1 Tax=Streptococcus pluranimalium TaxID=82348 RepID=UPI003F68CF00
MVLTLNNDIIDIEENLILKRDGSVFAIYEINPYIVNLIDNKKKENVKSLLVEMLSELEIHHNFDIAMLPYPKDIASKFETLSESFALDTQEMAYKILNGSYNYLMATKELCDYRYFLSVPLKSYHISTDLKEVVDGAVSTVSTIFTDVLGFEKNIYEDWHLSFEKQREELEENISVIDYKRLSEDETKFVNAYFYIQSVYVDRAYELSLLDGGIENLGDKDISFEGINRLVLHNESGDNHVAFLPVAYKPENASYLHLVEKVQSLGFPVGIFTTSIFSKTSGLPINNLRTKGRFARGRLKGAQQEQAEADSVGKRSIAQSKYLVEQMESKIDNGVPMVTSLQILVISDRDEKVLMQKRSILMKAMKDIKVALSKGTPYQLYLFAKARFGNILTSDDKNFLQPQEIGAFAEDLFFIKKQVGQDVGFYLGMIDNHKHSWHSRFHKAIEVSDTPVFVNLFEANEDVDGKDTSNPHIQVSGDTGTGKTFLVSYLHFYASLLNCKTLYIDPKCEKRYWYNKCLKELEATDSEPELQAYIRSLHFVTLDHTKPTNHGVLDPLVFLEGVEAKDLIVSMIDEFSSLDAEKRFKTALLKKITEYSKKRANGEKVGTLSIFKDLQTHDDEKVRDMADLLVEEVTDSVLSLIFSDGQNSAVDLTARNTILEIKGLDLPNNENAQLSLQNRKSLAVMYALGNFCIRFGERDYGEKTLEVIDEAWTFNITSYGRSLIDRIKRVGRSQNNFLLFVSQEPDDSNSGDDEATAFGTYFCFHNDSENSSERVLSRLKVAVTDDSKAWFDTLTRGQCLFKDTFGRVERITVDGLFPAVNKLFKTVRVNKQKEVA